MKVSRKKLAILLLKLLRNLDNKNISQPLLEAVNISQHFDYPLFNDLNFSIYPNQSIAIVGASGSGKSTFLNILSTLLSPNNGKVFYNSQDIYSLDYEDILEIRKSDFGIIFQSHYLFRGFNAEENIKIAQMIAKQSKSDITSRLDIDNVLHQNIGELSGGQQQRVSIARVLAKNPKIIFADEPTGNLDSHNAFEVISILLEYVKQKNDRALVIVTHEEKLAYMCDRVLRLENQQLKDEK